MRPASLRATSDQVRCRPLAGLVVAALLIARPLGAQASAVDGCGLAGSWRFVELMDRDGSGNTFIYPAESLQGYLIYTPTGQMSVQLLAGSGGDSPAAFLSYFGTWFVDGACRTVTHRVEGGNVPEYTGADQARPFRLRGDTLTLGDEREWRRVLVRVGAQERRVAP